MGHSKKFPHDAQVCFPYFFIKQRNILTIVKPSVRVNSLHQNVFSLHILVCAGRITRQHGEFSLPVTRTGMYALMETLNETKIVVGTLLILTPMKLYFACIKEEGSCKN